jgi:hypothetical protein
MLKPGDVMFMNISGYNSTQPSTGVNAKKDSLVGLVVKSTFSLTIAPSFCPRAKEFMKKQTLLDWVYPLPLPVEFVKLGLTLWLALSKVKL